MREKSLFTPTYRSALAQWMERFIEEKRASGYRYDTLAWHLQKFDQFLQKRGEKTCELTRDAVEAWTAKRKTEGHRYHRTRASVVRQFAKYLIRNGVPAHLVPDRAMPVSRDIFMPYIFTSEQMGNIFNELDRLPVSGSSPFRHLIMPEIFRVLYGCGLRISEAMKLRVKDVDLTNGVLVIRDSKFGKDRLVPMQKSLTERLRRYSMLMGVRNRDSFFFPAPDGGRYETATVRGLFKKILFKLDIVRGEKRPGIRLHDIRHTMAVTRLKKWYQEGVALDAKLPVLSTYLGHQRLQYTYIYLKCIPSVFPEIIAKTEALTGDVIPERSDR